jgi:prepilin-type N-terminal cleavage/methylation domain-containing protein
MSRHGFTLTELLLVLVLLGLLSAFAAPRVLGIINAGTVRAETGNIVTALDAARGAAIRLGAVSRLTLSDSGYQVDAMVAAESVAVWRAAGPAWRGVQLTGTGQPLLFAPSGIAMGASNRTLILSRGAVSRHVVVSRLGRLTW